MSFLQRFFRTNKVPKTPIVSPDDSHLQRRVKEAKWLNARAVSELVEAASKQERDANLARQIIHDVLMRAELKAQKHAGNKK